MSPLQQIFNEHAVVTQLLDVVHLVLIFTLCVAVVIAVMHVVVLFVEWRGK